MMYQGIIISGTDMTECYEIAKNLELSQSYKIVRVVSNSKRKNVIIISKTINWLGLIRNVSLSKLNLMVKL